MPTRTCRLSPALLGLLAACSSVVPADEGLTGSAWVLSELPGRKIVPGSSVTLAFDAGRASGTDGCNRYTLPYTLANAALDFDARGATTMMACPAQLMEQASAYAAGLARTKAFRVAAGQLELLAADGELLARFAAQPAALAGTGWTVTAYNNGRQAVTSVEAGTTLTILFGVNGIVSGSAGCNSYTGSYASRGAALRFGPAATTRKMCAEAGVMAQEQAFLRSLGTVATARREADQLELRTAGGALAIQATRGAPP